MRKLILSLFILGLFVSPVFSQINIKKEDRIYNCASDRCGYCAWSCIETLARHHKIKSLYGLKDKRAQESDFPQWEDNKKEWITAIASRTSLLSTIGLYAAALSPGPYIWIPQTDGTKLKAHRSPGSWIDMRRKLDDAKVKYYIQEVGNFSKDWFAYAAKNKLGCMIVVKDWSKPESNCFTHAMIMQSYTEKDVILFDPNDIDNDYIVSWNWIDKWWTGYILIIDPRK